MSGGSRTQQVVQSSDPWRGVQPYLRDVYQRAQSAADVTPTTPFPGPFSPPPTPAMSEAVGGMANLARGFIGSNPGQEVINEGNRILSGHYLSPSAYVQPAVEAITRPMVMAAVERVLPNLGMQASEAGAFGDTGHRFQEALVARDVNQIIADTSARLMNEAWDRERRLTALGPEMISSGMRMQAMPHDMLYSAGGLERDINAYPIQEALTAYRESIEAPWRAVNPYASVLGGIGSMGGGTTTTTQPAQSALSGALGGAMGGAALGMALGAPYTIPLALLGGALGLFR